MRVPSHFLPSAITGFLLWLILVSTHAANIDLVHTQPDQDTCIKEDIAASRLSPTFFISIAHAVHSITVEDLQFYFNANANETNNIPTVNQDRLSNDAILNHAPKSGSEFRSQAMKTMDLVLSHMDEETWGAKNTNTLERIVHAFHMQEMWSDSAVIYKEMLKEPPTEVSLCPCLKDVENNGVFHELRMLGLYIREPALMYNMDERLEPETDGQQGRTGRTVKFVDHESVYNMDEPVELETDGQQGRMGRTVKFRDRESVYNMDEPVEPETDGPQGRMKRTVKFRDRESAYNLDEPVEPETDGPQGRMKRTVKYRDAIRNYRQGRKLSETVTDDVNLVDEASWEVKKTGYLKPRNETVAFAQALYFYCMLEL